MFLITLAVMVVVMRMWHDLTPPEPEEQMFFITLAVMVVVMLVMCFILPN